MELTNEILKQIDIIMNASNKLNELTKGKFKGYDCGRTHKKYNFSIEDIQETIIKIRNHLDI